MAPLIDSDSRALPVLVGVLCILAVGMTAATLTTVQTTGGDAPAIVPPSYQEGLGERIAQSEGGNGSFGNGSAEAVESGVSLQFCVEFLNSALGTVVVFGSFVAIVGGIYRRFSLPLALLAGWILLSPTLLFYFLFTNCASGGQMVGINDRSGGESPIGDALVPVSEIPMWALALLVGVVMVGAVGMLYRSLGEEEVVVPEEESTEEDPELDEFAEAAGRAADRIEEHNADVDNAVYRAWVEMTGLLDVESPEMYTPGEFAEEAIALGMAEGDVGELTKLFNEVRYGGMDADVREDRALEILRNIESEYGDAATTTDPDDGDSPDEDTEGDR